MPPTQEQLDQWRKEFEAARSFEDDDLWLPPSPKAAPSTRNTASATFGNGASQQMNGQNSYHTPNAPNFATQPSTTANAYSNTPRPLSYNNNPGLANDSQPQLMLYNSLTGQWVPAVNQINGQSYFPGYASIEAPARQHHHHQSNDARNSSGAANGSRGNGGPGNRSSGASGAESSSGSSRPEQR